MDLGRLLKWIIVIAIIVAVYRVGIPWLKKQDFMRSAASVPADSCSHAAEDATNAWGGGLGRFVNPPYDLSAWSAFRDDVLTRIRDAERKCGCSKDSCQRARAAMSELRSLVSDLDRAIRDGSAPPSDVVQRQEGVDEAIAAARELESRGK